jgi:hypothetical protein
VNTRAIGLLMAGLTLGGTGLLSPLAWSQGGTGLAPPKLDVSPIGKVITLAGAVRIEHTAAVVVQANLPASGSVPTKIGDAVFLGDLIQTGPDGKLGVTLADGTSFNMSANARIEVDEFVYDPKGHSNSALLSLTKGTFTFLAGSIAHDGDLKIDTPVATMGIRGTAPRVEILPDGTVKFSTLIEDK